MRNLRQENSLRRRRVVVDVELEAVGAKHLQVVHHRQLARGSQLEILPDHQSRKFHFHLSHEKSPKKISPKSPKH